MLIHDLTNRKSEVNLRKWLAEVLTKESSNSARTNPGSRTNNQQVLDEYDPEQFIGSSQVDTPLFAIYIFANVHVKFEPNFSFSVFQLTQIPILVKGTKLDLAEEVRIPQFNRRPRPIAEECGAVEIYVVYLCSYL
jgi:Rab-like protein 3